MKKWNIFDNDSLFGKFCGRVSAIVLVNLMFVITIIPIFSAGAGMCAMYYTMLSMVRNGEVHAIAAFWKSFRQNFKQATAAWILLLLAGVVFYADLSITGCMTGSMQSFQIMVGAVGIILLLISMYLFPVMAAFQGKLPALIKNSFYFIARKPLYAVIIVVLDVYPMAATYLAIAYLPLSAFLWCFIGFALIAYINSILLYRLFKKYLNVPGEEDIPVKTNRELLKEMVKLGM